MSTAKKPSASYEGLAPGPEYSQVYAGLAQLVPPSEPDWLPSIAVAVQELVNSCPWLGRELRYYVPDLRLLPELVADLRVSPPDSLPLANVAEYPAQAALAISPTKDSWLRPPKALMLTLALRAIQPSVAQESSPDIRAQRGFSEMARFARGLRFINVRQPRAAFLAAAERESTPLAYATALCVYMENPTQLPASPDARVAKPDFELLRVLKRDILPLLRDLPPPKWPPKTIVRETEGWELDDEDETDFRVRLRLGSTPGSIEDAPDEDSIEIAFDRVSDLGHVTNAEFSIFEDPFARRLSPNQSIYSANNSLSTFHADALTKSETKILLPAIRESLDNAIENRDATNVSLLLTLLLMFATGLTKERAIAILGTESDTGSDDKPFLSDNCEELIAPALNLPSEIMVETKSNHSLVFPQDRHLRLPLPQTLASRLRIFGHYFPSGFASEHRINGIYPLLRFIADSVGLTAATLGRLRRTAAPILFSECNDLVAVMHLTRDTFGRSLAPLHYVSFDASVLRAIYRRAMWPHFGDDPEPKDEVDVARSSRVGSAFCPVPASALKACANVGSSLHAGKPHPDEATPKEMADVHNAMAAHLAALLVSVVGHRPNEALFRLTIHDFDPDLELGLFTDKDIDPAHLTRIAALGKEVSKQLDRYIRHLHGLIDCKNFPSESIARVRRILKGSGPLIFGLDESGYQRRWSVAAWQGTMPSQWRLLQPNFGRHYLASRGRELNFPPEWIHIQLGHQDVAGYPFSPDSPLFPVALAQKIGPLMDQLFKEQGWKRRSGFEPTSLSPDPWAETGPMRVSHSHSVRYRRKLSKAQQRFREELRAQLRPLKSTSEKILVETAQKVSLRVSSALCFRYNTQRIKRDEEPLAWPDDDRQPPKRIANLLPAELDQAQMESLLSKLEHEAGNDRALQIALTNKLAYALEWLRKRRKYSGPYCGAYRMQPLPDESPFYEGIFRATKQILALRKFFSEHRTNPFTKQTSEAMRWEVGKAALAVCIFAHVDDLSTIWELLSDSGWVERIPASPNSLLVHLPETETTVGLYGVAALAYTRWRRIHGGLNNSLKEAEVIFNDSLQALLPQKVLRKGQGIKALLQTVRVANRVELPGLIRTILDPEAGAVALPPDRLRSLLDPAFRAPGMGSSASEVKNWSLKRDHSINEIDAQVRMLQTLIPATDKEVKLPFTGRSIQLKTRQYEPTRKKFLAEMDRWVDEERHDDIVRMLAGWLGHLCKRAKFRGSGHLSWKSVQDYFGRVALPLVRLVGRGGLKELSVEDLEDLYLDLLNQQAEKKQAATCTQLLSFHDYLVSVHRFEPVDESNFREFIKKRMADRSVSNQIVLPAERELMSSHLQWLSTPDSHPAESQAEVRLHTQAFICFVLAASTGARISEIAGLKHKDIIRIGDEVALILRPNGYRQLKTRSSRRVVDAGKGLEATVVQRLGRWLDAERDRIGLTRFHNNHVFSDLKYELVGTAALRSWYTPTLKAINSQVSSHHLRHTRVNEVLFELLMGIQLDGLHRSGSGVENVYQPSCLPRELMKETGQIGHRRPRTSATCYFHLPFAASISVQRNLHGHSDKKTYAAAMGISTSGVDNLAQKWKGEHIARVLDRCARRREMSDTPRVVRSGTLPGPMHSDDPRMSMAVDLLAQGSSVTTVVESVGLTQYQIESLMEQDRRQATNTGIALIPGNPHGNARNSNYPRWRAGSSCLKHLWAAVEMEQNPGVIALLHGWRLSAARSDRSKFMWDSELIAKARACLDMYPNIKIDAIPHGRLYSVSVCIERCVINHELAFTLAVADVVAGCVGIRQRSRA